ncbi:MAG: YceI family protein [Candidatus Neomarinimicrobiota bacterium]
MKKMLIFVSIINLAFCQALNKDEIDLVPKKEFINLNDNSLFSSSTSTVILNENKSIFLWSGGLKFGKSNHTGNLKMLNGSITLDDNNISGAVVIDMQSLSNLDLPIGPNQRLTSHLRSPDFFNVEKYPKAKLIIKSSKVLEKLDSGKYKMRINGDMTIKNKTNPITFEAIVDLDSNTKTAEGKLLFDRSDFNVQYRSEMHLSNPNSFWNKVQTSKDAAKDKVIRDIIEINFNVVSLPGILSK